MRHFRIIALFKISLALVLMISACSGGGGSSSGNTSQGSMNLSIVDAPGDFSNVYITVKDVWFHTDDTAGPNDPKWLKYPLAAPVTVDLLTLANGKAETLWNNIQLPTGSYRQMRVILSGTKDALTASAMSLNLQYNNEVITGGNEYPLHVPDALHGIRLVGTFAVQIGGTLNLAVDFDAGHDIVDFRPGEYILKPRLAYFDLDHAGAIKGKLTLASGGTFTSVPRFVIKAERLSSDGTYTYHVVRRWTVPKADGTFVLYPVSTLVTGTWDIVIRGVNYQTVIIKGVPVIEGSTVSSATDLGTIAMTDAGSPDYLASASITSPTGAWVQYYQTLPNSGEYPYEIRFRHFHPLTGQFAGFPLSNAPISVGTYTSGTISFVTVTPQEGIGGFIASIGAELFDRSSYQAVNASTSSTVFPALTVTSPYLGNTVTGVISMTMPSRMDNKMDKGVVFAVHGGMIVNAVDIGSSMATGGTYTMMNLPGGSATTPLPGAFYGIEALGWSSTPMPMSTLPYIAIAIPQIVDLRTGDDSVNMQMIPLWQN